MTVEIKLSKGYVAIVDDEDADLAEYKWSAGDHSSQHTVYARRNVNVDRKRTSLLLHRVILGRMLGISLTRQQLTDHVDGDGLNCRRENLRLATAQENASNRRIHRNNTSGVTGISWHKKTNKWQVHIKYNGKYMHLGYFEEFDKAVQARRDAERELFKEFVRSVPNGEET